MAAVLALAGVLCLFLYAVPHTGQYVQVEVDGTVVEVLPLDRDCEKIITTADGGENRLVIHQGTAAITEANCPDKICVGHAPISRSGESVICLPHRLTVSVVKDGGDSEIDIAG